MILAAAQPHTAHLVYLIFGSIAGVIVVAFAVLSVRVKRRKDD